MVKVHLAEVTAVSPCHHKWVAMQPTRTDLHTMYWPTSSNSIKP